MKRTSINIIAVVLFCLNITSTFAQDKKVAMLESIAMTDGISTMVKNMVRGELTKSLSLDDGFSAFTRLDIDQLMKEYNFQESGMVNDEQRLKLGKMSGADYVCISKISKEGDAYYIEASLIHIETGRIDNPGTAFAEGGISSVNLACQKVAANMVGKKMEPEKQEALAQSNANAASAKGGDKSQTPSVYPKEVYNEAYTISILGLTRVGRTLTLYFNVKNNGRYATNFECYDGNYWAFTLYSASGDVITASRNPSYNINTSFQPGMTIRKKAVFNDVPTDIKGFTHLVFQTEAAPDQSGRNSGIKVKHSIRDMPIEKMDAKTASKSFWNSLLVEP